MSSPGVERWSKQFDLTRKYTRHERAAASRVSLKLKLYVKKHNGNSYCSPFETGCIIATLVLSSSREVWLTYWKELRLILSSVAGVHVIRGMRIRVVDILDLYASGLSAEQILDEMPDLEMEDLQAALQYAARRFDHPVFAA